MEFPYEFRKVQRTIVRDIENALENSFHMVFEAPTGSGKTIATLYPSVKYALKHGMKILYLVHTNSQEQQVIKEAKKLGVSVVAMQGRSHLCPLAREREDMKNGTPEELALLCGKLKKDVISGKDEACPYFSNYIERGEKLRKIIMEGHPAEEIFLIGKEMGICPYEALKNSIQEATVVVFPYIYFFYPFIRRSILDKMGVSLQEMILIVDEAHNIPEFARELQSMELSVKSLESMEREALEFGNPQVLGHNLADLAEFLKEAIYSMEKFVQDEEGIIPDYAFEDSLSLLLGTGINSIEELAKNLIYYGEMVREERIKKRKLPRSHIHHTGSFLHLWKRSYSYEYVRLVRWSSNPSLEIYSMDPSLVTEVLLGVHSSIHLSGTLQLEEYRNLVGLPEKTMVKRYPWPFPRENLKVLYVDDVTTKYGEVEKHIERYAEYIEEIISMGRNTAIFFPSYSILSKIRELIGMEVMAEERGMKTYRLHGMIEKFRSEGGTLLSVIGGRVFEGLDFPGEQLEIVAIVGIPYPKPTPKLRALEMYYDSKFGNGWEYTFRTPALIKMRQAIGRLIRGPKDRGIAIILDKRAASFRREIPMQKAENIKAEIENFFRK